MERSSPVLEEIFDEKLRAYATLDYKELKHPIDYYQSAIKSQEHRACSRERASPSFLLPRGRSSPTVLANLTNFSTNNRRVKPDSWVCESAEGFMVTSNGIFGAGTSTSFTRPNTPSMVACDSSISPKRAGSPFLRSKVLANRDKESLMDEIIGLKKALLDQSAHLQRHKVVSTNLEIENRKLEKELEEMLACQVPQGNNPKGAALRIGPTDARLRAKIQGLKARVSQLEATCEMQQEELMLLRRDMRVTRTRELEAERDVFAEEIERLQALVRRFKVLQNRLFCENKQLLRFKDRTSQLEVANQRLENSSNDLQKSLEKVNKDIHDATRRANESSIRAKRAERQCQELQEQSAHLSKAVEKEKSEKLKLQQIIHGLQDEVQSLQASLSLKAKQQDTAKEDHHHEDQGILAKTWGFLHHNPFNTAKTRELVEDDVASERPKTRGEQRTRLGTPDDLPPKSRPKSPTKAMAKRTIENTTKLQPSSGFAQQHELDVGECERRHISASNNPRPPSEADHGAAEKKERDQAHDPAHPAAVCAEDPPPKDMIEEEERAKEAHIINQDQKAHIHVQIRGFLAIEDDHKSKEAIANLVEGMISLQESKVCEERAQESMNCEELTSTLHLEAMKPASSVVVPRLNLIQVSGGHHRHYGEEINSEESSNALHTSATNMLSPSTNTLVLDTRCEQAHLKVIAWNDNIHSAPEGPEALFPSQKLAITDESTDVDHA